MPSRTVDPIYIPFVVTTPAGTLPTAPLSTPLAVEAGRLEAIDVLIPNGHQGATGILFTLAGQQILPWSNAQAWIIGNDLAETFTVDVDVDQQLRAVTYNTGNYNHAHYLRCRVRRLQPASNLPAVSLIDHATLSAT